MIQRIMRASKMGIRDTLWKEEKIGVLQPAYVNRPYE